MIADRGEAIRRLPRRVAPERRVARDARVVPAARVLEEEPKTGRWFAAAGAYYDPSLDYPLPLLGANYFDYDFKKSKTFDVVKKTWWNPFADGQEEFTDQGMISAQSTVERASSASWAPLLGSGA